MCTRSTGTPAAPGSTSDGNRTCDSTVETCPSSKSGTSKSGNGKSGPNCPTDFKVEAKCKIVCVGQKIELKASNLDGFSGGTFTWSTKSPNIKLTNANNSPTVTVEALKNPSKTKGAEIIKVTRTSPGCKHEKQIAITVAKVTFSASSKQRYGFDDFDTPTDPTDDHICIKKSDHTFVQVTIEGGLVGTDFKFECSDSSLCAPEPATGSAKFDLKLNSGRVGRVGKKDTELKAVAVCDTSMEFAKLSVHVYKEKAVNVVIAKIDQPKKVKFNLRFPKVDYAAHQTKVNDKLKEGVVKYNMKNFDKKNGITKVIFKSKTGELSFDITSATGGSDFQAIDKAMPASLYRGFVRVAIIRKMRSYYYTTSPIAKYHLRTPIGVYSLDSEVKKGDTKFTVKESSTVLKKGDKILIDSGSNKETITVTAAKGNAVSCGALTQDHSKGTSLGSNNTFKVKEKNVIFKAGDIIPIDTGKNKENVTISSVSGNTITCNALSKEHATGSTVGENEKFKLRGKADEIFFVANHHTPPIGKGKNSETVTITAVNGNEISCKPLNKVHPIGSPVEYPAVGWSSDPILIQEDGETLNAIKWTIPHEVGHQALDLDDVDHTTNFMHHDTSNTDNRLRYCPRKLWYAPPKTENQWDKIPRT